MNPQIAPITQIRLPRSSRLVNRCNLGNRRIGMIRRRDGSSPIRRLHRLRRGAFRGQDEAAVLQIRAPEVDQQPTTQAAGLEIVENLGRLDARQRCQRLEFHNGSRQSRPGSGMNPQIAPITQIRLPRSSRLVNRCNLGNRRIGMIPGRDGSSPRIPSGSPAGSICMRMRGGIRLRSATRSGCAQIRTSRTHSVSPSSSSPRPSFRG